VTSHTRVFVQYNHFHRTSKNTGRNTVTKGGRVEPRKSPPAAPRALSVCAFPRAWGRRRLRAHDAFGGGPAPPPEPDARGLDESAGPAQRRQRGAHGFSAGGRRRLRAHDAFGGGPAPAPEPDARGLGETAGSAQRRQRGAHRQRRPARPVVALPRSLLDAFGRLVGARPGAAVVGPPKRVRNG
jgi:hypothetical protein